MSILRTEPEHRAERGRHLRAKRIQERERGGDSASDLILKLGHRPLFTRTPLQTTPRRVFVRGEEENDQYED